METITILMSTYNGEKYLHEQLESIFNQTYKGKIKVLIRDDGSTDNTLEILNKWKQKLDLKVVQGDNVGVVKSFLELVQLAPKSSYYSFCDQDDIWNIDKLERSINMLKKEINQTQPLLYFSNVEFADQYGNSMNKNIYNIKPKYSLGATIVSNPCLGCTMVYNNQLMKIVKKSNIRITTMHDKLVLLTAILCGKVIYDNMPTILYRQHDNNVMGRKNSLVKRIKQRYRLWIKANGCSIEKQAEAIINSIGYLIKDADLEILKCIMNYKYNIKHKYRIIYNKEIFSTGIKRIDRSFRIRVLLGLA